MKKSWLAGLGGVASLFALRNALATLDLFHGSVGDRFLSAAPFLTIVFFYALIIEMSAERERERRGHPQDIDTLPRYAEREPRA